MLAVILISVLVGLVVGVAACYLLLRRLVPSWAGRLLAAWKRGEEARIRAESATRSEAVLRGRITEQLAPLLPDFGFDPADARFIGNPVDFIVFDGYEEVRLGTRRQLRGIAFIDIKTGRATLTTIERRIKLAIEERNLWCHTLGAPQ